MTPWLARLHRWIGLVVALQFALWLLGGLTMSLLDPAKVDGSATRAPAPQHPAWPADARSPGSVVGAGGEVESVESAWLLGRPVYRIKGGGGSALRDARSGEVVRIDAATASAVATADYAGNGHALAPELLSSVPIEARDHEAPLWRIHFDDPADTTLYVSTADGRVLERRNRTSRLFDVAWMLHIMDYRGRSDFNHPLVVTAAAGGTWMALSGLWLLGAAFGRGALRPAWLRRDATVSVTGGDGVAVTTIHAREGEPMLAALAQAGLPLPSRCGGGQTCGQCVVRVVPAPTPTAGDRARIEPSRLADGYRLACALGARDGLVVQVADVDAILTTYAARVESVTPFGPWLREVVLRPEPAMAWPAGASVEVGMPAYSIGREALSDVRAALPAAVLQALPARIDNPEPIERPYSPALASMTSGGAMPLLVRLDIDTARAHPVGRGSAYLFSLRPGDRVQLRGPFGDFRLREGRRPKFFIGGGAGMAPLRAMLRQRLADGGNEPMQVWIGARDPQDVPYVDELAQLAADHPHIAVHTVFSASDNAGTGPRWLHDVLRDALAVQAGLADYEFYVCGPPVMLDAVSAVLCESGVSSERIAFDRFGA